MSLYADDTIVLAESAADLQRALDALREYCTFWGLEVNVTKTKVVIISRGKVRIFPEFRLGTQTLEVVADYNYLGVLVNYNGRYIIKL